ncbi:hypothetical protein A2765_04145 [Candidatus Kaiserbacteria bacterium RIFCSPHIGHO2_01_FULL_56_24]|uniref:Protein kinase domain-containing protein n=1 Tax=Candidatus Kaiserbacteria bacterium RIFCSPHIGHO2_01_FULL_56_24 TaxID=1798487 RepID=A0A1F6DED0_9BACT|nr:MAG: hypothetical protein A2765_04145 [Candidatus Kaiserbacteria bacterium RIFCSPHIGHO2_01_FULL_56_24]
MSDAIRAVASQLKSATTYAAIFGPLPQGDLKGKQKALKKQFHLLARMVHPDYANGHERIANETFQVLNEMHARAEEALMVGTYDSSFVSAKPSDDTELTSANGAYRLAKDTFRTGDFAAIYHGTLVGQNRSVLAKIALEPALNSWLEREAMILARFRDAKSGNPVVGIRKFVPDLIDTFLIGGPGGTRYRVNILGIREGFVSVADIIQAYPAGLNPAEAAWVARRIIAQALAASMAGVVHGAITPDHVLVDPQTHEPMHIGWAHAIDDPARKGGRITHVIDRWRDFYPPEVFDKKTPDHRTDLYMAGKTIVNLLGGDVKRNTLPASVPDEMKRVILRLVEKTPDRRPRDGKAYLDEFTRVVRKIWGKAYLPLTMPVR